MKKFCIITIITNNYEYIREPLYKDDNADYFLLTDNKTLISNTYKIIYINELDTLKLSGVQKYCILKYCFYKYIPNLDNYDYFISIDGSMQINNSLQPIIDYMRTYKYDLSIALHPIRDNFNDEYNEWVKERNLDKKYKDLFFNSIKDYDYINIKGLCETGMRVLKNTTQILNLLDDTHNFITYSCNNEDALEQCYFTYILYKYIDKLRINYHPCELYRDSKYITLYIHNTDIKQILINTAYKFNDIKIFLNKIIKINNIDDYEKK